MDTLLKKEIQYFLIIEFITCNPLRGIWKFPGRTTIFKLYAFKN